MLSFGFVVLGLAAISGGLIFMLVVTFRAIDQTTDMPTRKLLARLAWLSLALLLLTLLLLVWAVTRHLRYWLRPLPRARRSEYVNAWVLAGQRFKLEDDEQDDEPDLDEDEPPPGGG
jgi:membrane protein implicated in regulation of membrane protease activity